MLHADARPRIHLRQRGDVIEAAGHPNATYRPIVSLHDAIDNIAGAGASSRPAVIIWEGIEP